MPCSWLPFESWTMDRFENLFIGVNEIRELLTWRFTKTTSFLEIIDMLKELTDRCGIPMQNFSWDSTWDPNVRGPRQEREIRQF